MRLLSIYLELGKARLSALVVFTTLVGYVLAARGMIDWWHFTATLIGTGLCAWSANALNQWAEWTRDARMKRTEHRPLPAAKIGLPHAFAAALAGAMVGLVVLTLAVNALAGGLALATIVIYVCLYTPLKVRSTLNTLVGAVVGAIPPMIGWAAATGRLDAGAWVLASVLGVWQIPHFLSLAWMYRDDYRRGGFRMLPSIDPDGRLTGRVIVLWSIALVPVTAGLSLVGATGWWYAAGSLVLGGWLVVRSIHLRRKVCRAAAKRLFVASVIYLPLLLGLMLIDRAPGPPGTPGSQSPTAVRVERPAIVVPAAPVGDNPIEPASLGEAAEPVTADRT